MNSTEATNWAKHLQAQYPSHEFCAVLLSQPVYFCSVTLRLRKLCTEGRWGVSMDGNAYDYPPTPGA